MKAKSFHMTVELMFCDEVDTFTFPVSKVIRETCE